MKRIDETKLTDYVMGELDAAARAEVEAAMAEDEKLRAQYEELQRTMSLLQEPHLQPVLGQERREALRAAARDPEVAAASAGAVIGDSSEGAATGAGKGRLLHFPGMKMAAALLICGGAFVALADYYDGVPDLVPANSEAARLAKQDRKALGELGYAGGDSSDASSAELEAIGYVGSASEYDADSEDPIMLEPILGQAPEAKREEIQIANDVRAGGGLTINSKPAVEESRGLFSLEPDSAAPEATVGFIAPAPPSTPSTPATPGVIPTTSGGADDQWGGRDRLKSTEDLALLSRSETLYDQGLLAELEALGYASDDAYDEAVSRYFDDFSDGDFRARSENILPELEDELRRQGLLEEAQEPICTLTDGYGRRYVDDQVIEHIRPAHARETPQDMFFRYYGDNPEVFTRFEPLSTFAADVDTASYPMARNYLVHDQLPPKSAIRTEEFLNYFDYALPAPTEEDFTVHLNASQTAFGEDRLLVSVGIKAREVAAAERKPMNLVFVLDKSGSMAGERMQLVKDALMMLVDQIRDTDTIGLVTFDSTGHVVLEPTPGTERYRIRKAIRELSTGGSTNAGQGLELGYGLMEKVYDADAINRVVLASDGVANTGETDQVRILKNVTERAEARVDLTTLGVGMGNHNDVFLEQLADQGNGSCHYLDDIQEAERVLVEGFLGTMITVARDVKIQVEFDEEQVLRWRQLGYENRSLAHKDFRNDAVDAGEVGSGHEVVALYEVQAAQDAAADGDLITVRLRWKPEGSDKAVEKSFTLDFAAASGRWSLAPVRLRQQAVVAQYAEVLRRSVHSRTDSYTQLMEEADRLAKELSAEPEVVELRDMIRRTRDLARWTAPEDRISMLVEEARRQRLLEAELAMAANEVDVEELLEQVRQQNQVLEGQLQEILQRD